LALRDLEIGENSSIVKKAETPNLDYFDYKRSRTSLTTQPLLQYY